MTTSPYFQKLSASTVNCYYDLNMDIVDSDEPALVA